MPKETHNTSDHEVLMRIERIVVNAGIGKISSQPNFQDKILPDLIREFALVTGQKPRTNPAKKSIAGFKVRAGAIVGLTTTLRGRRMVGFLARFNLAVLPRIRDFRGVDLRNVDAEGNLTIGIKEHIVFPEVNPETSKVSFGLQVTIVPRRMKDRDEAIAFYRKLGVPLKKL